MQTFKRVLQYSRPYWWRIGISVLASLGVGGMDGAFAFMVEPILKWIFTEKNLAVFAVLPLGVIAIFLFRGICRFLNDYFIRTAGQLAIQDIRNDLYRNNLGLSLRFFNAHPAGALMSRVLGDVSVMQEGVANIVTGFFRDGFGVLSLMSVLFYRDWKLALISIMVIPLTVYPAQKIGRRIKQLSRQSMGSMGDVAGILQETYSGIKVVKAFGLEQREVERFCRFNRNFYGFQRKAIKYEGISSPVMEAITSLGVAAVIWFGGSQVMAGRMTAAAFFSFVTAMMLLYSPVKRLINSYNTVQRSMGAAERVFEIIDEKSEITEPAEPVRLDVCEGNVEFRHVSFRYNEEEVLSDINLKAARGEVVALVGPSGGGKTTLVSLISRFYDVTAGEVLIDGVNVRSIGSRDLTRQFALVDQETILFNETIANNIRYGQPDATDAEVETAARAAFAHDFIMTMPDGYATNIGDRGVRLSGGQRQRVCIARAILKNAPILILDEATSALDTESEQMVQKALDNLMANRTTFVIAHRLSTIHHADRIAVLEKGTVVETGTHQELLARDGLYRKLYDMQFRGQGVAEAES
jgi:subfamily B ATP-binding cassette protein MsbA